MTVTLALWAVTALAHTASRDGAPGQLPDPHGEDGIEIAQGLALAAFGIFATIAVFAVLQALGIDLIRALFDQLMP